MLTVGTGGALVQLIAGDAQLSARVGRIVLVSCDAFDNFPPGLTGKTLFMTYGCFQCHGTVGQGGNAPGSGKPPKLRPDRKARGVA